MARQCKSCDNEIPDDPTPAKPKGNYWPKAPRPDGLCARCTMIAGEQEHIWDRIGGQVIR